MPFCLGLITQRNVLTGWLADKLESVEVYSVSSVCLHSCGGKGVIELNGDDTNNYPKCKKWSHKSDKTGRSGRIIVIWIITLINFFVKNSISLYNIPVIIQ